MQVFDRYLFRQLLIATVFTAVTLTGIIFLTQSLRFLELVINSGASAGAFWFLTAMTLPRFLELILPIALMAATVFVYNRMTMDSELIIMRAIGAPPLQLVRPALSLAMAITVILWVTAAWITPASLSGMNQLRQIIKAQYSSLLFREGVFNAIRPGLTVFVRDRTSEGELRGLMIHDSRKEGERPVTILAKRGQLIISPDGQQVIVYDGSRQDINQQTGTLNRLDFERYTIDLPETANPVRRRWREPEERSFAELLRPDPRDSRDIRERRSFMVEAHRRIASPLLAPTYTILALAFLLLGPVDRRGQSWRIFLAISAIISIQTLYLAVFNIARERDIGVFLMYALVFGPMICGLLLLGDSAVFRRLGVFLPEWLKGKRHE